MAQPEQLATLQALFPSASTPTLEKYLAASNNNLERAFAALERNALDTRPAKRQRTRASTAGLDVWLGKAGAHTQPVEELVLSDSDDDHRDVNPSSASSAPAKPFKSAYDLLRPSLSASTPVPAAPPPLPSHVNLPPLRLTGAAMIKQHTGGLVTLVENALPVELASRLFVETVRASKGEAEGEYFGKPWTPNKWYLVDREVTSPHTSAFYRELPSKMDPKKGYDPARFDEAATNWYNGAKRDSRPFTPGMDEARELVGEFVRTLLAGRERHPLEWAGPWEPNVAAANCYRGKQESVGWHSDVLQYLGPQATIASLTLGVGRPFRLRPFIPSGPPSSSSATPSATSSAEKVSPPALRTLELYLPHNSLLIMHAGVQETFKHCVPPVSGGMDVFKIPKDSLQAGVEFGEGEVAELMGKRWVERINMTFRHYRPDFAPLPSSSSAALAVTLPDTYAGTPICPCGVPCTLRPDGRGRVRAHLASSSSSSSSRAVSAAQQAEADAERPARYGDEMVYFWTCAAGAQNAGKTCGMWRLLDMKKEGRGKWYEGVKTDENGERRGGADYAV